MSMTFAGFEDLYCMQPTCRSLKEIVHVQASDNPRGEDAKADGVPYIQNWHMEHAIKRTVRLSSGHVLQLKIAHDIS